LSQCCPVGVANISRSIAKYGDVTTSDGVDQLDAAATVVMTISPWYVMLKVQPGINDYCNDPSLSLNTIDIKSVSLYK